MSVTATRNIIELQKAGNRALTRELGHDDAQAFLKLCRGNGDFTKERHEWNLSHDDIAEGLAQLRKTDYTKKLAARGIRIVTATA